MADTNVVIHFFDGAVQDYFDGAEAAMPAEIRSAWDDLVAVFPFLTLNRLYTDPPPDVIGGMLEAIRQQGREPPNLLAIFRTPCPEELSQTVIDSLMLLPFVEFAEEEGVFVPASVHFGDDPQARRARHLDDASSGGIDAFYAWTVPGGDGARDQFRRRRDQLGPQSSGSSECGSGERVIDSGSQCESGSWNAGVEHRARDGQHDWHRGNRAACTGIRSAHSGKRSEQHLDRHRRRRRHRWRRWRCCFIEVGFSDLAGRVLPAERHLAVWRSIRVATELGVTVVAAAGNSSVDLDLPAESNRLKRGDPRDDSGSVMVAAARIAPGFPIRWFPEVFTNRGSRIDCFAQGSDVPTSHGDFAGTSAASAIIAGAAASIQGMALARFGGRFPRSVAKAALRGWSEHAVGHFDLCGSES